MSTTCEPIPRPDCAVSRASRRPRNGRLDPAGGGRACGGSPVTWEQRSTRSRSAGFQSATRAAPSSGWQHGSRLRIPADRPTPRRGSGRPLHGPTQFATDGLGPGGRIQRDPTLVGTFRPHHVFPTISHEEMEVSRRTLARHASAYTDIWAPGECILFERGSIFYKIRDCLVTGYSPRRTGDHKAAHISDIGSGRRFHRFPFYTRDFAESSACAVPMNASRRRSGVLTWVLHGLTLDEYISRPRAKEDCKIGPVARAYCQCMTRRTAQSNHRCRLRPRCERHQGAKRSQNTANAWIFRSLTDPGRRNSGADLATRYLSDTNTFLWRTGAFHRTAIVRVPVCFR
jgi:hypothetical protein